MKDPYKTEFPGLAKFVEESPASRQTKLKVCIATEDIVGPIRNGGIGTTYTYLSKLLAQEGHDVTILYLRGDFCENETIEHWVNFYADFSVRFVPLDLANYPVRSTAPRWIEPMYALYEYLKGGSFDVVHISEWHGSGYYCLLAKRLGLAFESTQFCVKTSSPWLWNREHGFHTIRDLTDLPKIFTERRSVELADFVIGGSRHLLCWMVEHGYAPPAGSTYVQPNVVVPLNLDALADERREHYGERTPIEEIVFFGRLEYRKGLDVFCDAIDVLVERGVQLPNIYLMGKYGERIPSYPEMATTEYVRHRIAQWPAKVEVLDNFNTEQAVTFLLNGKRLAVMPSIIENSTLAVYETAYYAIPFIASNRGGTPELVLSEHREEVLVEPHPIPLANALSHALDDGGFIAAPSFSNARNLETWRAFHQTLGGAIARTSTRTAPIDANAPKAALCIAISDNHEYAKDILGRLDTQHDDFVGEVIIVDNGSTRAETKAWLEELETANLSKTIVGRLEPWGEQHAQNHAATLAVSEILVFPQPGSLLRQEYFSTICRAAARSSVDIFGTFFDEISYADLQRPQHSSPRSTRVATMVEDHTSSFFNHANLGPTLAVRKSAFAALNGFRDYGKVLGAENEFVSRASCNGIEIATLPESLTWQVPDYPTRRRVNRKALPYRSIMPYLENCPEALTRILMTARGFTAQSGVSRGIGAIAGMGDSFLNEEMTLLYGSLSRYPKLRQIAISTWHLQTRLFGVLLRIEAKSMRAILRLVSTVKRRLLPTRDSK